MNGSRGVLHIAGMIVLVALLQSGCGGPATKTAGTASLDLERIEEKFVALEEEHKETDSVAQKEIEALRTELQALMATKEEEIRQLNDQNMNLGNRVALLSDQVEQLQKSIEHLRQRPAPPSKKPPAQPSKRQPASSSKQQPAPPPSGPVGVFRPATYKIEASYQAALRDYNDQKYDQAIGELGEILAMAPQSNLADNAQYWIGECYYALKDYRHALSEFQKVLAYSKTNKADAAQLKIAMCYLELGDRTKARAELRKLIRDYPKSEYVPRARSQLQELGE